MIYTKKTPWTLIMGVIMVAYAYMVSAGMMEPLIKLLHTGKHAGEMVTLGYWFGGIAVVVGLWQLLATPKQGQADYYISTIGGLMFIMLIAFVVKWGLDPMMGLWGKNAEPALGFNFAKMLNLNYVVMGIIAGIIVVNVFKIPEWAQNGVRLSRLGLKTGVILLGTLYSLAELAQLGKLSVVLIGFFVLGSVGLVLWMGARRNIPNSMGGVLSAGLGVCGVSAAVAAAPVVQAKSTEIAYTIGTILLWGILMMFIFPIVGKAMDMGPIQFGAWAGTGILNSAQVAGAALAFQPDGIETLKVAEIFNITRVLFLPIIVLWLAVWYVKREQTDLKVNLGEVVLGKFPVFVLGFILMFALSSTGVFAPAQHYKGKFFDNSEAKLVKTDKEGKVHSKLLKDEEVATLQAEVGKVQREDQKAAIARLMENKKTMSIDDDTLLRGVANAKILSKDGNAILKKAHGAVYHTAGKIKMFRNLIAWFFTFGLVGLGMQITMASIKQAGGQPLIIGTVVGATKAIGALIVVMMFVHETI
ncbi:MAG: YeiH family protein [Sulfuricaulis sp.]|uniref:YeiH family protein n=1 Tax=Sulfuricaulis sp. TaxID=2003553 RepID=UPI0025EA1A15|nr:putative sulfate exporter family transporter [Sulfuricaulis sp.]MCR4347259.1 YeiH family protein [Sulfuricaulis sp.]